MSYFHTGIRTIIGAESFHGPVRDGKGWDQLAMVIRLKLFVHLNRILDFTSRDSRERIRRVGILVLNLDAVNQILIATNRCWHNIFSIQSLTDLQHELRMSKL